MTRTRLQRLGWIAAAVVLVAVLAWQRRAGYEAERPPPQQQPTEQRSDAKAREAEQRGPVSLPAEAHVTLDAIKAGGPFPHRQDGGVFQNREGLLPAQPRGYYREYTVRTPGARDRGARRIVTGGDPPTEYFYTSDHYRSFQRFEVQP